MSERKRSDRTELCNGFVTIPVVIYAEGRKIKYICSFHGSKLRLFCQAVAYQVCYGYLYEKSEMSNEPDHGSGISFCISLYYNTLRVLND